MAAAAPLIADPIVRNRGTLVGSLCHADPQGDWASVVLALGGSVVARRIRAARAPSRWPASSPARSRTSWTRTRSRSRP